MKELHPSELCLTSTLGFRRQVLFLHCCVFGVASYIDNPGWLQILEQVYSKDHIAVANERLKLTSIAHAAGDTKCALLNLSIVDRIMRIHYGPHYSVMFPYIASLQQVLDKSGSFVKN